MRAFLYDNWRTTTDIYLLLVLLLQKNDTALYEKWRTLLYRGHGDGSPSQLRFWNSRKFHTCHLCRWRAWFLVLDDISSRRICSYISQNRTFFVDLQVHFDTDAIDISYSIIRNVILFICSKLVLPVACVTTSFGLKGRVIYPFGLRRRKYTLQIFILWSMLIFSFRVKLFSEKITNTWFIIPSSNIEEIFGWDAPIKMSAIFCVHTIYYRIKTSFMLQTGNKLAARVGFAPTSFRVTTESITIMLPSNKNY